MYVLALVTQKGGSGKSTLTVGIAVAAMGNGELGSTADLLSSSIRRHRGAAV
jgi:MinD-like ATPase involved in chromosome partitioning or flagellar assembly